MGSDDLLSVGDIANYVAKIHEGKPDVEGSKALLRLFCERSRANQYQRSAFPEAIVDLLVSAFEKYLSGEEMNLEKSLGLKRRGRPANPDIKKRNIFIARDVMLLNRSGKPLFDNFNEQGAVSTIAEKFKLGDNDVRDIYYEFKEDAEILEDLKKFI